MALDVDNVLNSVLNVLKNNTSTIATSLTSSSDIKLIKDGDPLTEAPITLDLYPAILVKLSQEIETFDKIGQRGNKYELVFDIFSMLYSTAGGSTSEKDVRKISQNIKKVLKDNITLSTTAASSMPEQVDYFLAGLEGTFLACSQITLRTFHWST